MTAIQAWFPTFIYYAPLRTGKAPRAALNRELLRECRQLRAMDEVGVRWCRRHYPGGYTSYASHATLHLTSPTFSALERRLRRHVAEFTAHLELDLEGRELTMTDCWVNMMPRHTTHSLHLHPLATISGTYYVATPKGSSAIKFEDPRMDRFMAHPPRRAECRPENRAFARYPAQAGHVVLFESWLRHEVPASMAAGERVSVSFNYNWF
jgi:uncharacterized protein (TIGR02466 family)